LKLTSDLHLQGGAVELTGTHGVLHDKQGTLELSVPRVSMAGPRIEVTRARLEGAGALQASVSVQGSTVRATATSERLDIVRLAALAGVATPLHAMKATLDLDATYGAQISGRVVGEVVDIAYDSVKNGRASFDLGLHDNALTGRVATELAPGARLTLESEGLKIFRLATARPDLPEGKLKVSGKVDLTCMGPLITATRSVPINEARGSIDLDVEYARAALGEVPTLRGRVRTHDLAIVGKRPQSNAIDSSGEAIAAAPSVYSGVDFGIDLALDAPSGRLITHVGVYDAQSELMQLDASAGPLPRGSLGTVVAALADLPLEIDAHVPARRLRTLPPPIRPLSLRGTVAGDLHFKGTVREPELVVDARGSRLTVASERIEGEAKPRIGALAHLEVKRTGGALKVVADSAQVRAMEATLDWSGDVLAAAQDPARFADFTAKARVIFDQLELENIPALKNRQIEGRLSGTAALEYAPDRRLVSADIAAHPLRLGQATLDHLNVSVRAEPTGLSAAISSRGHGGSLDASVTSGLHWPKRGVPELAGDIVALLGARGFRLGALWPLVSGSVNELDGKLDADLRARVQGDRVELSGKGRLSEGVVQIPALGQRFESIGARISVAPAAIVIDDLDARGLTGGFKGNGRIELDEHLGLRELDAALEIQKKHKLPVTLQGVSMGDAWGKLEAKLVKRPDRMDVTVRVPDLHIEVPDTAGGGVQDLGPAENVRIGVRRADAVFTALPVQPLEKPAENPTPLDVNIELGSIWLKKGDLVTAQLSGKLHAAVADKSVLTGRIDLKAGDLDVQGKRFEIERGTVTFTGGDPANPTISAEARWDAPAGYSVYASYTGTAQKGKLELRAEPPLTQDEIVNLILFGTPEGSVAAGGGDAAASAVGLAGGTAAKGINRAISDFTHLDIQARIDTSTGSARPELMIPITPKLSARVTRAIGEPTPGTSPDRTFLTLELRLKRNWALSALLGDRGASALDLIWRKHY
ncbi:MAG TPA: translocation/assembly module TamB domain-containing protein, partial [Polyangiaceae bacterium]|nr:translocation/assembly module TamB domain-containing protein [Polyangiaceae bacterium]